MFGALHAASSCGDLRIVCSCKTAVFVYDLMIKAYKEAREKRTIPATFDAFTGFCEIFVNREASAAMRQPSAEHKT